MIASLRGVLEHKGPDGVVVNLGSVSLRVLMPSSALEHLGDVGDRVYLYTYLHVREDALTLYGFPTDDARRMFETLIDVSGIGPRLALSILSSHSPESLAALVSAGDTEALGRVPGVGKRTASRLVLELRGRLEKEWGEVPAAAPAEDGDVVAALMALGYSSVEARRAATGAEDESSLPLEERLRRALQRMGGGGG